MEMVNMTDVHEVVIKNMATGKELSYKAENTPNVATVGHTIFGALNPLGFAELQAQGYEVYDEKSYCALIRQTFNLSEGAVGKRGPNWSTPAERSVYQVLCDGIEFTPAITYGGMKKAEAKIAKELEKAEKLKARAEAILLNPILAVADTTPKNPIF